MSNNIGNHTGTRREDWGTPKWLFDYLNGPASFNFAIDLAARADNALCDTYIGIEENTLNITPEKLIKIANEKEIDIYSRWCWLNPPYGKNGLGRWGRVLTDLVPNIVALIPASVGAMWFQPMWTHAAAIVLVAKRLHFDGAPTGAQFDSALFIMGNKLMTGQIEDLRRIGTVILAPGINGWSGKRAWEDARLIATATEES